MSNERWAVLEAIKMVQKACAVVLLVSWLSINGSPQKKRVAIHNGFLKAREFLEMPDEGQRAYAMGFMDGMYIAPYFGAPENNKDLMTIEKCVEGMSASQVAAIIEKYVKDYPQEWHWDLKAVAYNAMHKACAAEGRT